MNPDHASGFTLLELVIAMALIGLVLTIIAPMIEPIRARAEKVACIANLRSLHIALNNHLVDRKQWPQVPQGMPIDQQPKFWTDALEEYGASRKMWLCPTLARMLQDEPENAGPHPRIHYMPGQFGPHPSDPLRYPGQPWALEIGNMHGDGVMVLMTDGSVRSIYDIAREQGIDPLP